MKMVKSLEELDLLIKAVGETIEKKAKEEKGGFLCMLLGTLGASLLGNLLAGKGELVKVPGQVAIRTGGKIIRVDQDF